MERLQIKKEYLAQRCEICHQADCFDPVSNICTRCQSVTIPKPGLYLQRNEKQDLANDLVREAGVYGFVSGARISLLITLFYELLVALKLTPHDPLLNCFAGLIWGFFMLLVVPPSGKVFGERLCEQLQSRIPNASTWKIQWLYKRYILLMSCLLGIGLWLLLGQICG
ncbi:MAG: hypothetical protein HY774_16605 [Acidobacteria bacterium]|nr:hypothetical protein [Acidobacteriota bacterium]